MNEPFCFTENVGYYLNLVDFYCPPEVLFGLAEVMATTYNRNNGCQFERINGRNGSHHEMLERYSKVSGIAFSALNNTENITDLPCLIELDDYYLDYHPFYMRNHYLRLVVLLHIYDDHVEIFDTHHRKLSKLTYNQSLLPNSVKYTVSKASPYEEIGLDQHMAAIEHTCMLNMMELSSNQIYTGYNGIGLFLRDLEVELSAKGEKELSEITYDLFFQMLRPGGLKNSREMFAKYLRWVSRQYSIPELGRYADSFALITAKWESAANLFYKANVLKKMDFLRTNVFKFIERVMVEEKEQIKNLLLYILTTEAESI
jgi:hypothetical protein